MADEVRCPECGRSVPADVAAGGLCPACLLALALDSEDEAQAAGDRVGPYLLIERLGEGGMGIVYLAEQDEPIHRRVALKVIKVGMDTREVLARFDSERQALALMDHPNIARVLDAGVDADGRPYFVMEYVPGVPITEFCDTHQFSTQARLTLMQQVCAAVQHAHQRGIIHRDLKPSNVLVMEQDGQPVPKVIDFGVAKAIEHNLLTHTLFTDHGRMVGTPEYMSPEQAALGARPIDTRTDIYSLGVLLYELLVGMLPFEVAALRRAGYDEMRRIIREVDPPKPSTRVSTLGDKAGDLATRRQTLPGRLQKQLRGDLDWITLKALEKDPARRYASASELAADIVRHLHDEPVTAGPPGPAYRTAKFVRKHRAAVIVGSLIVLLLTCGIALTTTMYLRADSARREAERSSYSSNLLAADYEQNIREIREAKRLLDRCPPRLRGWEWEYLRHETDASVAMFAVPSTNDPRRQIGTWDRVAFTRDRIMALGTMRGFSPSANVLAEFTWPRAASAPAPGTWLPADPKTSIVAVSGDGRRLLVTRWWGARPIARTITEPRRAGSADQLVELRAENPELLEDDRNRVFVTDARSGEPVATLTLGAVGVWRGLARDHSGISLKGGPPIRRVSYVTDDEFRQTLATVSYPVPVRGVLSEDGSRAAAWSWDNVIHVWDVPSGRAVAALAGHEDLVSQAVFLADGRRLVSASLDRTVRVWDLEAGRAVAVLGPHQTPVTAIAVASEAIIAAGLQNGVIRVWRNAKLMPDVQQSQFQAVTALAFDEDAARLLSGSEDRTLRVWDTRDMRELLVLRGHEGPVTGAALSPDGRMIASSSNDGTIRLWNARAPLRILGDFVAPQGIGFLDGGSSIVTTRSDDQITVWDVVSGRIVRQTSVPGLIASLAVSRDARRIAVGLVNRPTRNRAAPGIAGVILDGGSLTAVAALKGQAGAVHSVAFHPDGTRVATASDTEADVWVWETATGRVVRRWPTDSTVVSLAIAPDAAHLAAGLSEATGLVRVWPMRADGTPAPQPVVAARLQPPIRGPLPATTPLVAFTPDGTRAVSGGWDSLLHVWNVRTGQSIATLRGHDGPVHAIAVSPDGKRIASGSSDASVRIWSVDTGDLLLAIRVNAASPQSLAFSPDGGRIAAGVSDGTVRVWNAR